MQCLGDVILRKLGLDTVPGYSLQLGPSSSIAVSELGFCLLLIRKSMFPFPIQSLEFLLSTSEELESLFLPFKVELKEEFDLLEKNEDERSSSSRTQ